MGYTTWHDYGYGIKTDDIHTDLVRLKQLIRLAPQYERWLHEYFQDKEISEPSYEDYMDVEDDYGMTGLASILKEVIAETEDIALSAVNDFDGAGYLIFSAAYPWSFTQKERALSEADIEAILKKYISVLTDEEFFIDYQSVENGG